MFPESNETKIWSQSFHIQNSGILQTRMYQRGGDPMKMNFDNFQIQHVQLQGTPSIWKLKLQSKTFLIVPMLEIELAILCNVNYINKEY